MLTSGKLAWDTDHNIHSYFSPCSVSFVLSVEYIQYSPLINFRLIISSNIHLQLIIPSNIHLQCLCSTKNEKKTTSRRQFGIQNYFYSESLTQPRSVKNKYVILSTSGICVYSPRHCAPLWINHISPRCLKITYTYTWCGTSNCCKIKI
jgi:hypothetical protein